MVGSRYGFQKLGSIRSDLQILKDPSQIELFLQYILTKVIIQIAIILLQKDFFSSISNCVATFYSPIRIFFLVLLLWFLISRIWIQIFWMVGSVSTLQLAALSHKQRPDSCHRKRECPTSWWTMTTSGWSRRAGTSTFTSTASIQVYCLVVFHGTIVAIGYVFWIFFSLW